MLNVDSLEMYDTDKVLSFKYAVKKIDELKKQGKTVGLCHGGFDLLHPGHVMHFRSAKKLCDVLFVSITSDRFVSVRKGTGRPVYTDKLRAFFSASIDVVDFAVVTNFQKGVEVIENLKPDFYIKGPDFINKTTPGITAEREAIKKAGGEMKYTNEPPMSTSKIINYIKDEIKENEVLVLIDRDGTIITNNDFLGKNDNWKQEIEYNKPVVDFISYLQTKFRTTKIVVSNQAGVARKLFSTKTVDKINDTVNKELAGKGIKIDNWQYCPDVDSAYAKSTDVNFDPEYVKDKTKRKPSTDMVIEGLKAVNKRLEDFSKIIVIGDRHEDGELADALKAKFVDVNNKNYEQLVDEVKDL